MTYVCMYVHTGDWRPWDFRWSFSSTCAPVQSQKNINNPPSSFFKNIKLQIRRLHASL